MDAIAGSPVIRTEDYLSGRDGLSPSDVLKFSTKDAGVVIRPSGTEPKLKVYVSVTAKDREAAEEAEKRIVAFMEKML